MRAAHSQMRNVKGKYLSVSKQVKGIDLSNARSAQSNEKCKREIRITSLQTLTSPDNYILILLSLSFLLYGSFVVYVTAVSTFSLSLREFMGKLQ
jgi:hypothetical protein